MTKSKASSSRKMAQKYQWLFVFAGAYHFFLIKHSLEWPLLLYYIVNKCLQLALKYQNILTGNTSTQNSSNILFKGLDSAGVLQETGWNGSKWKNKQTGEWKKAVKWNTYFWKGSLMSNGTKQDGKHDENHKKNQLMWE